MLAMDLKNPHTGLLIEPHEHETRGSPTIGKAPLETATQDAATLPQDERAEPSLQERELRISEARARALDDAQAQARADANVWAALGIGPDVLARCQAEGASPKLVKRLLSERTAAKAALDGIDHVLSMLGIEAI